MALSVVKRDRGDREKRMNCTRNKGNNHNWNLKICNQESFKNPSCNINLMRDDMKPGRITYI